MDSNEEGQRFTTTKVAEQTELLAQSKKTKPNAFIDEDDDEDDYKENPRSSQFQRNELFINEVSDDTFNINEKERNTVISASKSSSQLNSNNLPRVKFLSDYDVNRSEKESQKQPLLTDKDRAVIEMNNPERWFDEKGLIINKEKFPENKTDTIDNLPSSQKSSKPIKVHYYKNSKSLELIFNLGGDSSSKETGCFTQFKYFAFYQALMAEIIGTYLLVLYVCSFGLPQTSTPEFASITGSLGSGFLVATLVWTLANVSGSNLNPAVSIALLITGESNLVRVLFYIPCQLLGSILAVLTLKELTRPEAGFVKAASINLGSSQTINKTEMATDSVKSAPMQIGLTTLSRSVTAFQGFGVECIITFILVLTIFACIDKKRKDLGGSFPLTIGFAITVGALFGGKFTGGSMNPARSFGPALVENHWENHWVYWTGPITGAIIAAFVYKTLIFKPKISKT